MTQNALNTTSPVIQRVQTTTNSVVTLSATLPRDNSIPQQSEGNEVFTLTITPTTATSTLQFFCTMHVSGLNATGTNNVTLALFQDSTANAVAAMNNRYGGAGPGGSRLHALTFVYTMTSGTASSTTFKIRAGIGSGTGPSYINGDPVGSRLMGGVSNALFSIKEYL